MTYTYDFASGQRNSTRNIRGATGINVGRLTRQVFDTSGNLLQQIADRREDVGEEFGIGDTDITHWTYDDLGRVLTETVGINYFEPDGTLSPVGKPVQRTWEYNNLVTTMTQRSRLKEGAANRNDRESRIVRTTIDPAEQTITEEWLSNEVAMAVVNTIVTTSNPAGQRVSVTDTASGQNALTNNPDSHLSWSYDVFGRTTMEVQDGTFVGTALPTVRIDHDWYEHGPQKSIDVWIDQTRDNLIDGSGDAADYNSADDVQLGITKYEVDDAGRVTEIEQDNITGSSQLWKVNGVGSSAGPDKSFTVIHYADGMRKEVSRYRSLGTSQPRGTTEYVQFGDGRLKKVSHESVSGNPVSTYEVEYSWRGDLTGDAKQYFNGNGTEYADHKINRGYEYSPSGERTKTKDKTQDPAVEIDSRAYDGSGNRVADGSIEVGEDNRLLEDERYQYTYDGEGNLIRRVLKTANIINPTSTFEVTPDTQVQLLFDWLGTPSGLGGADFVSNSQGSVPDPPTAEVEFNSLQAGTYEVWSIWTPRADSGVADYAISSDSGGLEVEISVNQGESPGDEGVIRQDLFGNVWRMLGQVTATDEDSIYVELSQNTTSSKIIFDALQLVDINKPYRESFEWDHRNRLASVTQQGASGQTIAEITYAYDGLNRRIAEQVTTHDLTNSTSETDTLAISWQGTTRLLDMDLEDSGDVVRQYLNDPSTGEVIAIDQSDPSAPHIRDVWGFADANGNLATVATVATVDGTGAWQILHTKFDDFGNVSSRFGSTSFDELTAIPQLWSGMFRDRMTGLYHAGERGMYDAEIGRYLTDGGGVNGYTAFGNQPSNVAKPSHAGDADSNSPYSGVSGLIGASIYAGFEAAGQLDTLASLSDTQIYVGVGAAALAGGFAAVQVGAVGALASNLAATGAVGAIGFRQEPQTEHCLSQLPVAAL